MSVWNALSSGFFHPCLKMIPSNIGCDALQLAFHSLENILRRGPQQNPLPGAVGFSRKMPLFPSFPWNRHNPPKSSVGPGSDVAGLSSLLCAGCISEKRLGEHEVFGSLRGTWSLPSHGTDAVWKCMAPQHRDVGKGGKQNTACAVEETLSKLKAITHMRTRTSTQDTLVFSSSAKGTNNNNNFKKLKKGFFFFFVFLVEFLRKLPCGRKIVWGSCFFFLSKRDCFYNETKKLFENRVILWEK